jgi:hypothetical protein
VQAGEAELNNIDGDSLLITGSAGSRIGSPVFVPSKDVAEYFEKRVYKLMASPRIFPGQNITAALSRPGASLYVGYYGENDNACYFDVDPADDGSMSLAMKVPNLPGPIFEVGLRLNQDVTLELDHLRWAGTPEVVFERPNHKGIMWRRAWVDAVDHLVGWAEMFRLVQNQGLGMISQGTREWVDYMVTADVTPHLVNRAGIAARVQGLTRFYALLVTQDQTVQLVRRFHQETILAEAPFSWSYGETLNMTLNVKGEDITGMINGNTVLEANDAKLDAGAIGLVVEEGRTATHRVQVVNAF